MSFGNNNNNQRFICLALLCLSFCCSSCFATTESVAANAEKQLKIGINLVNTGKVITLVTPQTLASVSSRFPDVNISIATTSFTHDPCPIYKLSSGSTADQAPIGSMATFLEPTTGRLWNIFTLDLSGKGEGLYGEILSLCGNTPSNAFQLSPFPAGSGSLVSLNGVYGKFSATARCEIVSANGAFKFLTGGQTSSSGIFHMNPPNLAVGTTVSHDLVTIFSFHSNTTNAFWFKW